MYQYCFQFINYSLSLVFVMENYFKALLLAVFLFPNSFSMAKAESFLFYYLISSFFVTLCLIYLFSMTKAKLFIISVFSPDRRYFFVINFSFYLCDVFLSFFALFAFVIHNTNSTDDRNTMMLDSLMCYSQRTRKPAALSTWLGMIV